VVLATWPLGQQHCARKVGQGSESWPESFGQDRYACFKRGEMKVEGGKGKIPSKQNRQQSEQNRHGHKNRKQSTGDKCLATTNGRGK